MSHKTSPGHRFSSNYENFYDPNFTAEISTKMQVPDRISVVGSLTQKANPHQIPSEAEKLHMHVPERILLAGGEEHIVGREPLPELRLESNAVAQTLPGIQLTNPPHVISLGEYKFPAVDDLENKPANDIPRPGSLLSNSEKGLASTLSSSTGIVVSHGTEDDLAILRQQVENLSRRLILIEEENQQRQQREIIVYSIGIIYFFLKGVIWLNRHW